MDATGPMKQPPRDNKIIGVRLSLDAQALLTGRLRSYYGLRSTAAIIETLIREKGRELAAQPAQPFSLPPVTDAAEDESEEDAPRRYEKFPLPHIV